MAEQGLTAAAPEPASRRAFIEDLGRRAALAGEAVGGFDERDFAIAGRVLRLRFAGPVLVDALTKALGHVGIDPADRADLTIDVWDSDSTGVEVVPPVWSDDAYREHGTVRGWFDDEVRILFARWSGALLVYEPGRRAGAFWMRSADDFMYEERAVPLRAILHLWLADEGLQVIHAAALGNANGCLLVAGRAGSGKSSTALACLNSDLGHIAEDFSVLETGSPPLAHSLYSSAKAHADTVERLEIDPSLISNPSRPKDEKAVIFLNDHCPERLVARAPIRAVVVPAVTGERESRAEPCAKGLALWALAPSTLLQLPGTGVATMKPMVEVVRAVPSYRLEAGTDPAGIASALSAILRG